jgi:carbon-monoxide dehydrogenase medium subunit
MQFELRRAGSLEEALQLLAESGDVKALAGGHSLIPLMKLRLAAPDVVVDISGIDGLSYVREDGDRIAIGALSRHADLALDPVLAAGCGLMARVAGNVGDPQVRHRGTIGGSVAHGDPASDLGTILLTLDADFVARGPDGEHTIPGSEFFTGPFETALGPHEVLTELRVPKLEGGRYLKHVRRAQDWATVAVAAVRTNGGVQVGMAGMGATPLRARAVEQAVAGGASPADAAAHAAEGADPPSDVSGSAEYRAHLARVLTRQALEQI